MPTRVSADQTNSVPSIPVPSEMLQYPDSRILAVQSYLSTYNYGSQIEDFNLATVFVDAADKSKIDYRILPSIFVLESTAGKHGLYNNYFGFMQGPGLRHFSSVEDSVYFISGALTQHPYAGKTLKGLVQTYNPPTANPAYYSEFMALYNQIQKNQQSFDLLIPMVAAGELHS